MTKQLTTSQRLSEIDGIAVSKSLNRLVYGRSKASIMEQVELGNMVTKVRGLLTPDVMSVIGQLQGTELGFRTDRESKGGYTDRDLVEPVLTAILKGFRCVDNEFNVIGGRFYAAQAGLERKVREFPGLTDLKITTGFPVIPAKRKDVALVPMLATYKIRNEEFTHDYRDDRALLVRRNEGMIGAALAGKAKRQLLMIIWKALGNTGDGMGDSDDPPEDVQEEIRELEMK